MNQKPAPAEDHSEYSGLIHRHLEFIDVQCKKALAFHHSGSALERENESLLLFNRVLDKLGEKNFQVLRRFRGQCKFQTYLNAIISRLAIDLVRHKRGRDQKKIRAREWGELGEHIHRDIFQNGLPLRGVFRDYQKQGIYRGSLSEFETIVSRIRGKTPRVQDLQTAGIKRGKTGVDEEEPLIPDTDSDPQVILLRNQRATELKTLIRELTAGLKGEEQLLIRLRFTPDESGTPPTVREIARILHLTPKAVYHRLDRILDKCRKFLAEKGYHEIT